MNPRPSIENEFLQEQADIICSNYERLTGSELLAPGPDRARRLYVAPFVVLSHDTSPDPVFNYANICAQELFELSWEPFMELPSKRSAEPVEQAERARLLEQVSSRGFIDDYSGIRISASGRRFRIDQATVWNLVDADGKHCGQAATFKDWVPL